MSLLMETRANLMKIRNLIECGVLSDEEHGLFTFTQMPEVIIDLLNELKEASEVE